MCSILQQGQRWKMHVGESIYFLLCSMQMRGLPATVGVITSLLTHLAGLACNEIEAFGWNDLSLFAAFPPADVHTHINIWVRGWFLRERQLWWRQGRENKLRKLLLNCKGNINRCWITLLISIKGNQLKPGAVFLWFAQYFFLFLFVSFYPSDSVTVSEEEEFFFIARLRFHSSLFLFERILIGLSSEDQAASLEVL